MNFYTLLANGYANMLRTSNPMPTTPRTNIPLILTTIGEALKISIANYATTIEQAVVSKNAQTVLEVTESVEKKAKQCDSKRIEGNDGNAQILKIIEKENISEKVKHQIENNPKGRHNLAQNLTTDQPSHSVGEGHDGGNKKQEPESKGKKDKIRNKKDIRMVGIPDISLILTAQLPQDAFSLLQLRKKRESLLRRRVDTWQQKLKNRRDKREIRMLNC